MEKKEKKMIWSRLKSMKCPKCGKSLVPGKKIGSVVEVLECSAEKCDFGISQGRFDEVVADLYAKKKSVAGPDNQDLLNNL